MTEKEAFSKRLSRLLQDNGIAAPSPTHIAHEFNRRYSGRPVSVQAVRKWLSGDAIPASDKIRTLSMWLKASPHWLHYGEPGKTEAVVLAAEQPRAAYNKLPPANLLLRDFQRLTPHQRGIVAEIVQALLRENDL